jgi:hypothetical protein
MSDTVTVLGHDGVGVVAELRESNGFTMRYYLTPCCDASDKGCDGYVGCRACYAEIDPMLSAPPDPLVTVFGDGVPWEAFHALPEVMRAAAHRGEAPGSVATS